MRYDDPRIPAYLPAIHPGFSRVLGKTISEIRPKGIRYTPNFYSPKQLDFISNPNHAYFHYPFCLYSAGHAELDEDKWETAENSIWHRDRKNSFVLVDSGGFQVGKGVWKTGNKTKDDELRAKVLHWQENISDLALILEKPTWGKFSFDEAVDWTQDSLKFYRENATGKVPFLNIVQGQNFEEMVAWYEKTKWFMRWEHCVGLGIGGIACSDLYVLCKFFLWLVRNNEIEYVRYIHLLGNGTIYFSVICYVLQRLLTRVADHKITITHDAASDGVILRRWGKRILVNDRNLSKAEADLAYFRPNIPWWEDYSKNKIKIGNRFREGARDVKALSLTIHKFRGDELDLVKPDEFYPYSASPIISPPHGIRFGDIICEGAGVSEKHGEIANLDDLSYAILYANNVFMKLRAITVAAEMEARFRRHHYVYERAKTDANLSHTYAFITGWPVVPNDPKHPIIPAVRTTVALYRLFQDQFRQDDWFEEDVMRLEREKEDLSTVLNSWINQEKKLKAEGL